MSNLITKIIKYLLKFNLSTENKTDIFNEFLVINKALPIESRVEFLADGTLLVGGKPIEIEQAVQLMNSARLVLHSPAFRLVSEQVNWLAVNVGFHQSTSLEQILFAKASVWSLRETEKLYRKLAQE